MKFIGWFMLGVIMLGLMAFFYVGLDEGYQKFYSWFGVQVTDSDSLKTGNLLNQMWIWFPIAILLSFIWYVIQRVNSEAVYE